MNDLKNYELEFKSINRSNGVKMGMIYDLLVMLEEKVGYFSIDDIDQSQSIYSMSKIFLDVFYV